MNQAVHASRDSTAHIPVAREPAARNRVADKAGPVSGSALRIQRTAGNQALQQLLPGRKPHESIQMSAVVNTPGDEFEREAEGVAERVTDAHHPPPRSEQKRSTGPSVASRRPAPAGLPPVVDDIVRSPGRPLDSPARAFAEPRFGADFGDVRVHDGPEAAASARDLEANAYTVGPHIVFGEGQFSPETASGRRLLSHELTHVVQQLGTREGGRAPGALPPAIQRDTPKNPPAAPPTAASPALNYDNTVKQVPLLDRKQTLANVNALLNGAVKKGDITGYTVSGVKPGSNNELFLKALVVGMGKRSAWNTEADLVTPIDWPAKQGDPAPLGRVTVRIDARGAATAELIGAGPVPAVPQTTVPDGIKKLTTDFGFASVTGWGSQNTPKDAAEVSDVIAALELLKTRSAKDLAALNGVDLIRVPSLADGRAGEFFAGDSVSSGGKANTRAYLKLANKAFENNNLQFAGGSGAPTVPASFETILHEVGHAVEAEDLRGAREGYDKAKSEVDAAEKVLAGESQSFDEELKKARAKGRKSENAFYKKQETAHKEHEAASEAAKKNLKAADTKLRDTRDPNTNNTKRLQKFVDLVTAKNIKPFTEYAAKNWPGKPEEFYAEAYSLWLVDPAFLKTNHKAVFDFFENGDYRQ